MEEGLGRIEVRFGTVEERRSGAGRDDVGCEAMFGDVVWVMVGDAIDRV
jgi:hypothetical protein